MRIPEPPLGLTARQRCCWDNLAPRVAVVDEDPAMVGLVMRAAVGAYVVYNQFRTQIAATGVFAVVDGELGINPLVHQAEELRVSARRCLAVLGVIPANQIDGSLALNGDMNDRELALIFDQNETN
ncbi:MAG TPA: hypothetical protein QGF05_06740 [Dehalococcoidia bacterium]|nr:hypothetical protein [Dehalococcoidia bacterium]